MQGFLAFQEVVGNFAAAVHVAVDFDAGDYQMGGFVLRDPDSPPENWIKWEIGQLEDGVGGEGPQRRSTLAVLTTNGNSGDALGPDLENNEEEAQETTLGICRIDGQVHLALRLLGTWQPGASVGLTPDLGPTLQLGLGVAAEAGVSETSTSTFSRFRVDDDPPEDNCVEAMMRLLPEG